MAGRMEGIRRTLVLGLVRIAWTAIEQAPSVGILAHTLQHQLACMLKHRQMFPHKKVDIVYMKNC